MLSRSNLSPHQDRLAGGIMDALLPVIEREVADRVEQEHFRLRAELHQSHRSCLELGRECERLQEEVLRMRRILEMHRRKCPDLELPTVEGQIGGRVPLERTDDCDPPLRQTSRATAKAGAWAGDKPPPPPPLPLGSQTDEPPETQLEASECQPDPLDFLASLAGHSSNNSIDGERPEDPGRLIDDQSRPQEMGPSRTLDHQSPSGRSGVVDTADPSRSRRERRQYHARDCVCCNRVGTDRPRRVFADELLVLVLPGCKCHQPPSAPPAGELPTPVPEAGSRDASGLLGR